MLKLAWPSPRANQVDAGTQQGSRGATTDQYNTGHGPRMPTLDDKFGSSKPTALGGAQQQLAFSTPVQRPNPVISHVEPGRGKSGHRVRYGASPFQEIRPVHVASNVTIIVQTIRSWIEIVDLADDYRIIDSRRRSEYRLGINLLKNAWKASRHTSLFSTLVPSVSNSGQSTGQRQRQAFSKSSHPSKSIHTHPLNLRYVGSGLTSLFTRSWWHVFKLAYIYGGVDPQTMTKCRDNFSKLVKELWSFAAEPSRHNSVDSRSPIRRAMKPWGFGAGHLNGSLQPSMAFSTLSQRPTPARVAPSTPENLSVDQYHRLADEYIDNLVAHLEELQEERRDVDCEYSVRLQLPPSSLNPSASLPINIKLTKTPTHRPVSSTSTSPPPAPTSSINNPLTNKSGFPPQFPAPNAMITSSPLSLLPRVQSQRRLEQVVTVRRGVVLV